MKKIWIVIMLLLLSVMPGSAMESMEVPGLDRVWEEAEDYGVTSETRLDEGLGDLFSAALSQLEGLVKRSLGTSLRLLAVVLFCAMAQCVQGSGGQGMRAVELAGAVAITALTMTDMEAMIGMGRDTIGRIDVFSQALLPVMAVLAAASGGITAAAVRQGATVLFSQLLIAIMDRLLIPLVYAYVAVSCAQAAVGNPGLQKLAGLLKGMVTFLLTAILLTFVGYLTASGAIAGSVDASAVKAARMAISRAIPVVGGILADASESVLAGAGVLKGTVGTAGLLVVLAICLTPFLRLSLQYLMYKGTAALCAAVAPPQLSALIDAIGSAFGLVLGMTGATALVLMVSLVSAVSAVTP